MKRIIRITVFLITIISLNACAQKNAIVGVWNVKTDFYKAKYEIVEYQKKFFGKIHFYNDGNKEFKSKNTEEDYFLTDIEFKEGKYINGKMYLPDGSFYNVIFTLKEKNTLEAVMTVNGKPYKETWSRNISN